MLLLLSLVMVNLHLKLNFNFRLFPMPRLRCFHRCTDYVAGVAAVVGQFVLPASWHCHQRAPLLVVEAEAVVAVAVAVVLEVAMALQGGPRADSEIAASARSP